MARKTFICTQCRRNFKTKYYLTKHLKKQHEEKRPETMNRRRYIYKKIVNASKNLRSRLRSEERLQQPTKIERNDFASEIIDIFPSKIDSGEIERRNSMQEKVSTLSSETNRNQELYPEFLKAIGFDLRFRTLNLENTSYSFWLFNFKNTVTQWKQFYDFPDIKKLFGLTQTGFQIQHVQIKIGDEIYAPFKKEFIEKVIF